MLSEACLDYLAMLKVIPFWANLIEEAVQFCGKVKDQSISTAYINGTQISVSCFLESKFRNRAMLYGDTLTELLNIAIGF